MSKTYALTGTHRELLKLSVPYDVDIDITADALDALRPPHPSRFVSVYSVAPGG
ncbi:MULTISPECIES: hypothetical protein [unclassified Streptomyces]|uniref:hypothetical protein n=1 Tax=unclassified Streptomyces TaxID=2593676 RepID=UPI002252D93C|nr:MULTISPECIES: hypothetical protein [unclassified Streptomyces]MCX5048747.1 hypothetical protein [Streptomyces sp. NBC_00474]